MSECNGLCGSDSNGSLVHVGTGTLKEPWRTWLPETTVVWSGGCMQTFLGEFVAFDGEETESCGCKTAHGDRRGRRRGRTPTFGARRAGGRRCRARSACRS